MEIIDGREVAKKIKVVIPKYMEDIEENRNKLMQKVDEYFDICKGETLRDADGSVVLDRFNRPVMINSKIPTVTGLALHLGLRTRQRLLGYAKNGLNADIIQVALSMVEEYAEMRLYDKNGSKGAMFSLCNSFSNWSQLDKDSAATEQLEKLDAILEATKRTALANGTNLITVNGKEIAIDVEGDKSIEEIENEDKKEDALTNKDVENGMIGE